MKFEKPEMTVIRFDAKDIICTSGEGLKANVGFQDDLQDYTGN